MACGTIAAIHSIGNNLGNVQLEPGSMLEEFFLKAMGSESNAAEILQNSDQLHEAH